jgi:hypothetical protein
LTCGSYETTKVKDYRLHVIKGTPEQVTSFKRLIAEAACVVAVGRMEQYPHPDLEQYAAHMQTRGVLCPLLPIDVRDRAQVTQLLDMLLLQLEIKAEA